MVERKFIPYWCSQCFCYHHYGQTAYADHEPHAEWYGTVPHSVGVYEPYFFGVVALSLLGFTLHRLFRRSNENSH